MLIFTLLVAISSFNLTGFWHSTPDLSEGYKSCYFFWDTGEYAFLESIEEDYVYMGSWFLRDDELVLDLSDAISVGGMPLNVRLAEIVLDLYSTRIVSRLISLDGEYFFLLERNPQSAILSLVPTWGMTDSERNAFSAVIEP
ncbi:MAG: hypothetical protein KAH31_04280 [Candidatus Sabulitectum sp.]|nr:hypothetical protein [Candidatus Sabulitectum sp.]